jgi:hypothetical protein|nr:MAG TPA: Radical SAM superfamily [Caudoviricetes sp.]
MSSTGFLDVTAKNMGLTAMDVVDGNAATQAKIPCLDWCGTAGCNFLCPHCHPTGGRSAAKVFKAYYTYVTTPAHAETLMPLMLKPRDASALAERFSDGRVASGDTVQWMAGSINVLTKLETPVPVEFVDNPAYIRSLFARETIAWMEEGQTYSVWFGHGFCGIGIIQYHQQVVPDALDNRAMQGQYAQEIIDQLLKEQAFRMQSAV